MLVRYEWFMPYSSWHEPNDEYCDCLNHFAMQKATLELQRLVHVYTGKNAHGTLVYVISIYIIEIDGLEIIHLHADVKAGHTTHLQHIYRLSDTLLEPKGLTRSSLARHYQNFIVHSTTALSEQNASQQ